jgi:hypothetical protein
MPRLAQSVTANASGRNAMEKMQLLKRLAPYVSEDDVDLDRLTFLQCVADRINDDLETAREQAAKIRARQLTIG